MGLGKIIQSQFGTSLERRSCTCWSSRRPLTTLGNAFQQLFLPCLCFHHGSQGRKGGRKRMKGRTKGNCEQADRSRRHAERSRECCCLLLTADEGPDYSSFQSFHCSAALIGMISPPFHLRYSVSRSQMSLNRHSPPRFLHDS